MHQHRPPWCVAGADNNAFNDRLLQLLQHKHAPDKQQAPTNPVEHYSVSPQLITCVLNTSHAKDKQSIHAG